MGRAKCKQALESMSKEGNAMDRTHRMSKLLGVILAVLALMLLLLWMQGILGGGKISPGEVASGHKALEEPYTVDMAQRTTQVRWEEAVGTVEAKREVIISPRIMGTLLDLPVNAGESVVEGQLLCRLDDRDIRARQGQARSAVTAAESEYERASKDYQRFERLLNDQAVTQQQFETARAVYRGAEARLRGARDALKEAEVGLGYTVIRSPVAGYVVEKHMETGDMAAPGRPIVTVQEEGGLRLEAAVREGLIGSLLLGDSLRVRIDALEMELSGTLQEKVPVADPRTRSFLVKVSLPQKPGLRSGMFGRLFIPTGSVTPLTVSSEAVESIGQIQQVWVLSEEGVPQRRYVRTGRIYADRVEILSGLREGERVVVPTDAPSSLS
jgi:RND family efflux transporter MFP subunit